MTSEFTTEVKREIWEDSGNFYYGVSEDQDKTGMVAVVECRANHTVSGPYVAMNPAAARQVAKAMLLCADEIEQREK